MGAIAFWVDAGDRIWVRSHFCIQYLRAHQRNRVFARIFTLVASIVEKTRFLGPRDRIFWFMGDRVFRGWAIGYNIKKLTPKITVRKELIQQELEKLDREQLKQVFEFIDRLT